MPKKIEKNNSKKKDSKPNLNNKKRNLNKFKQEIVIKFLEMLNVVKIYHWKTHSYATHKATDELYERLNEHIDQFIEVLLGKDESRINLMNVKTVEITDYNDVELFKKKIQSYKKYLIDLNKKSTLDSKLDSDLFTIRDDILVDLNQFLYLLTFT
jgi:DNA-binding ferritin-like protein